MGGQIRGNKKENPMEVLNKEKTSMYLVMGITGKVGGATARHLLKQGKQVRALVRDREKAAKWADQGVELVDERAVRTHQR
jgi:nucleoside-diphosphate-sugar epimerase